MKYESESKYGKTNMKKNIQEWTKQNLWNTVF